MKQTPALEDIDIFEGGLVSRDGDGLQITDLGLSLLRSIESTASPLNAPPTDALRSIDGLIGTRERLRIFDLELRGLDGDWNENAALQPAQSPPMGSTEAAMDRPAVMADPAPDGLPETIDRPDRNTPDSNAHQSAAGGGQPLSATRTREAAAPSRSALAQRKFGSKASSAARPRDWSSQLMAFVSAKRRLVSDLWRRHLAPSQPERSIPGRAMGNAPIALLTFLTLVGCGTAVIALGQLKSLKSELAMAHRDVLYLRERLAKLEQSAKAHSPAVRPAQAQPKAETEESKAGDDQAALNLSREEIGLIRDYIKPASSPGSAPTISVGDSVSGPTIPLPSPITDKIPRLMGARFTTRNGAIVIVKKDSHQAGAVLGAN
jgi:hypothetical protein